MEYVGEETLVEENDADGGWVETHHDSNVSGIDEKISEMTLDSSKTEEMTSDDEHSKNDGENEDEAGEEDAIDMEEFEESGMLEQVDPATAIIENPTKVIPEDKETDSVVHTRTYDLHTTYDKYYQTPRLWICGYDEVIYYYNYV